MTDRSSPAHVPGNVSAGSVDLVLADGDDSTEDDEEQHDEDDSRWLRMDPEGSRRAYHGMELFIDTIDDYALVDRLRIAIAARRVPLLQGCHGG